MLKDLCDCKNGECLALGQGNMSVKAYEAKLYPLSRNVTQLLATEKERI